VVGEEYGVQVENKNGDEERLRVRVEERGLAMQETLLGPTFPF
jgi:hypothetical protein